MTLYHIEIFFADDNYLGSRRRKAELYRVGDVEHQEPPRSYIFLCRKCGKIYGRRLIESTPIFVDLHEFRAEEGLCRKCGGGSLLHSYNEIDESDRFPDPIPAALLIYEFLAATDFLEK